MPLSFSIEAIDGVVVVRGSGEFNIEDATKGFIELFTVARLADSSRILLDNRKLARGLFATEKNMFALELEKAYRSHLEFSGMPIKIALITQSERFHAYRPFEAMLNLAGIEAKTFDQPAELASWLYIESNHPALGNA